MKVQLYSQVPNIYRVEIRTTKDTIKESKGILTDFRRANRSTTKVLLDVPSIIDLVESRNLNLSMQTHGRQ